MTIEAGVLSIRVEETGGDKVLQQLGAIDKQAASIGSQTGGIAKATAAFSTMAATLGTLGIAISAGAVIEGVTNVVRKTIDAADAMHDLAQRTGVSTENLSVLSFAADKAGVDIDSVTVGFKKLSTELDKLESGDKKATEAFARLGLNAQDLKGLSLDQVFVKIADAQNKFADGAGKTAVMTELFGRSGERLIPLMHDLADGGFAKAKERAEELGLVIGGDLANNADALNDNIRDMHGAIEGLGVVFATVLLPPLTSFVQWMTSVIASAGGVLDFFSRLWHMGDDTSAQGTIDKLALLGAFFSGNFGQAAAILAGSGPAKFTRMGPPAPAKPTIPNRSGEDAKESAADRARERAIAKAMGASLGDIPMALDTITTPTGPTPTVGVDKNGKMKGVKGDPAKMLADAILGSDPKIREALIEKRELIQGILGDVASSIGSAFGDAFSAAFSGDDNFFAALGKSLLKSLGNLIMQLGENMIEYAVLASTLAAIPGPWQALGLGAVATGAIGVGLVALGAGMGAIGGKGGKGHGGGGRGDGQNWNQTNDKNNQWSVAFDPDKKRAAVPSSRVLSGAAMPEPRQPVVNNFTIIGPDDQSAQRSIKKLLYNADRRGVTGR